MVLGVLVIKAISDYIKKYNKAPNRLFIGQKEKDYLDRLSTNDYFRKCDPLENTYFGLKIVCIPEETYLKVGVL